MRLYRIHTLPSGESAIEVREAPMSGPRPTSATFVHVAMPDDFDVRDWPLAK